MREDCDDPQHQSIEDRLRRCAAISEYPFEAFLLVYQSIPRTDAHSLSVAEIPPKVLLCLITDVGTIWSRAKFQQPQQFFLNWNLKTPSDLGRILKIMSDQQILHCESEHVFDHPETTVLSFERPYPSSFQWSLSALFVLTLVSAIVIYGYMASGVMGSLVSLFGAGGLVTGCVYLWSEIRSAKFGILELLVGIISLLAGAFLFWYAQVM